ncbi:translation initiation factor 2 (bIF-2) [Breoghania corrubedonensis]|uniref:Translation initiation factor IF-2 n=1 Tax=Breoghania corrubedonensis TaxID=665038 RepID=A0A2T5VGY4_9HYPH|nr:translation initiation factor IF-2 [Breoghania corrubedonensis]PTW63005.1 translation initiation factor 2 (bIF-2) [Breoghania corrubedonensis]
MSDTKDTGDKTIPVERKKTLSLSRGVEAGTVRQSFSHGRTKQVVVEKKKRRMMTPGEQAAAAKAEAAAAQPAAPQQPKPEQPKRPPQQNKQRHGHGSSSQQGRQRSGGNVLRTLTADEAAARAAALRDAQVRAVEERKQAEIDAKRRAEEEAQRQAEEEARRKEEEAEAKRQAEEEAKRKAEEAANPASAPQPEPAPAQARAPARAAPSSAPAQPSRPAAKADESSERGAARPAKRAPAKPAVPANKPAPRVDDRRKSKLTINSNFSDDNQRGRSLAALRRRREKEKRAGQQVVREKVMREVTIPDAITIQELANRMSERSVDVIKLLMKQGQMLKINDVLDADTAQLLVEEMGHTAKRVSESDVEEGLFSATDNDTDLQPRAPVVTIMGHVDHGKTSLLDALRHANVVSGEAGGITQHIGAYQVVQNGQKITFIDTPGHAAFSAMRARGAKSTDIVILVVAADDGVMPQTKEAVAHARAADVPIIVAINKIDKPGADPNRVRTELLSEGIVVESMGGDTIEVEVSAKEKTNLDKLLEMILLQSEVLELRANPNRTAEGTVIEAQLDKGRGPVATVLVQKGTLRVGDILVAGSEWARVRAMLDENGNQVKEAPPSKPVEVLGFQGTPEAGDLVAVVENEGRAREIVDYRQRQKREKASITAAGTRGSLEQMMNRLQEQGKKEVSLVIKSDVQGSAEAIVGALDALGTDEVAARVLHSGVGGITEADVTLAAASNAPIIGFNVRANKQAREAAEREGIEIRYYAVIYDLVDDVKATMSGLLSPERRETFLGNAEVLQVFNISKVGKIAGCLVTEGIVERGAEVRLIRDDVVVHEGKLATLKRYKDDVKSVESGQECGMNFEKYQDMRPGDVIECFRVEQIARTL